MIGNDSILRGMAQTYRDQAEMLRGDAAAASEMVIDLIDEIIALRARLRQLGEPLADVLAIRG